MEKSYDQKNKRVEIYSDDLKEEILENIKKYHEILRKSWWYFKKF